MMTGIAIALLFSAAFLASAWTLFASIRPQLHRFAELLGAPLAVTPLPARLSRVTMRKAPARLPVRAPLRAAA